jgi:uncharacterized protein (DUF1015 family)
MALRPQDVYVDKMISLRSSAVSGKCNGILSQKLDKGHEGNQNLSNDHIVGNLKKMISEGDFYQEEHPCIFIYEITEGNATQTGVWAVTDLDDFERGHIKTHESTLESNSSGLVNYRDEVGLEGGPLLITHRPTVAIRALLARIKQAEANSVYYSNKVFHRIWTVYDMKTIQQLSSCFSELKNVYLADGHHRLAAAVHYRKTKQVTESNSTDFNYISSLYLASDQLRIKEYHRVIIPNDDIYIDQVFRDIKKSFSVTKSQRNEMVMPIKRNEFGLYISGKWYNMSCRLKDALSMPDACLLQERIFRPFFNIERPETDQRLIPVGGAGAVLELEKILLENPNAIAFTMAAMNAEQLIEIAQQGIILPPKSTWIEPKIPFGLLLRKLKKVSC